MNELLLSLLLVSACGFGLVAGWLITKQEFEIKLLEAENNFNFKLEKAIRRNVEVLKDHNVLLEKIHSMAESNPNHVQLNLLWQEIHRKLSDSRKAT